MTVVINNFLKDRSVLVTGGTGSLGRPLIRRLLQEDIKKIICFSRGEHKQVEFERELSDKRLRFLIGDIRDRDRLKRAFRGIDFIIHCAALKHVPKCERDPLEAKKTNVDGAENIIEAAIDCGAKKVLAISTDKAVNPISVYGTAKALADDLFIQATQYGDTVFSVIRFGNFIGSRGSIVPLFKKQKELNVPLTITHPEMTRFFISFNDAVDRILDTLLLMHGGEVFYPKMKSAKILDIADIIDNNTKKLIGIRVGEKIHEELITIHDFQKVYETPQFFIVADKVKDGVIKKDFEYNSKNNPWWFTGKEIEDLIVNG